MSDAQTILQRLDELRSLLLNPLPGRRFLTTEQASQYLSISVPQLELWRQQSIGPAFVKVGRSVRYDVADLDAFMAGTIDARQVRRFGGGRING